MKIKTPVKPTTRFSDLAIGDVFSCDSVKGEYFIKTPVSKSPVVADTFVNSVKLASGIFHRFGETVIVDYHPDAFLGFEKPEI